MSTQGPPPAVPIVVVHGNPASNLWDMYLTQPEATFTLTRGGWPLHKPNQEKRFDRLPFHPDEPAVTLNTSGRAVTPARISALSAFYLPYEDLVEGLKREVGSADSPAPVFPFAYDWRFDSSVAAVQLGRFIREVLRITARLPDYKDAKPKEVDIVAHSYGGLVTARYLRQCQQKAKPTRTRVRKVVTIGSPFRGAVDAVHAMIFDLKQREAARTLPSVYGLLPTYPGAVVDETTGAPTPPDIDLLTDPSIWAGSSVERSLDAYCKLMQASKDGPERLEELRAAAAEQRRDFTELDVNAALGSADNWMPIVGIGEKTRVQVRVVDKQPGEKPDAEFAIVKEDKGGDGTVPFHGAVPPFNLADGTPGTPTPVGRLVCFCEEDIDLHERGDWLGLGQLLGQVSLHSFLPKMDAVQRAIFSFLRLDPPRLAAPAHPAPKVKRTDVDWPDAWHVTPVK